MQFIPFFPLKRGALSYCTCSFYNLFGISHHPLGPLKTGHQTDAAATSVAANASDKGSSSVSSVCDWSKADVNDWLHQIELPDLCTTLDFCNGSHLEMLYKQSCENPQGFKEEMKSEYAMTAKIHLQFTVALKQLFKK